MASSSSSSSKPLLLFTAIIAVLATDSTAFNCTGTATCHALVDYVPPNATTLSGVASLFGVKKLYDLLAANNLPLETPAAARSARVGAKQRIRVPLNCACAGGAGAARGVVYTVKPGDGLDNIARTIFAAMVTFQEIAAASGVANPDLILPGQNLTIPIPCSCDAVDGAAVVHYGYVVEAGSSVGAIAATYGAREAALLRLNGMANSSELVAGQLLDVPLAACSSSVRNDSLDSPLLVANGTYALTAHQCVKCSCASANNFTLQCEPSGLKSTGWSSCPSAQCELSNGDSLVIGNSSATVTCTANACAYAGYNNGTILTSLVEQSTCPDSNDNTNDASKVGFYAWSWSFLFVSCYFLVFKM